MKLSDLVNNSRSFVMVDLNGRMIACKIGDVATVPNGKFRFKILEKQKRKELIGYDLYIVECDSQFDGYLDLKTKKTYKGEAANRAVQGAEVVFKLNLSEGRC